jgi:DNA-binding transcriptional ArsR family regulator
MAETVVRREAHRRIADEPSLRALTHPTRLALIEAIGLAGALTATQASEAVGESPTACAYHLRMLGRLGFLEEAEGGHGRERPWRLAQTGMSFGDDDDGNPMAAKAAEALETALTERFIARIRTSQVSRNRYSEGVRAATGITQSIVFATPEEFAKLREEIARLLAAFTGRLDPRLRPHGSQPFEIVMFSHVLDVPGQGADGAETSQDT